MYLRNYGLSKTWSGKCLKNPVSKDPSIGNMVNQPKQFLNLKDSTFAMFIYDSEGI